MLIPPDRIYDIIEEHERCLDLQYFAQAHLSRPIAQRTWIKIKEVKRIDTILKRLKQNNRV